MFKTPWLPVIFFEGEGGGAPAPAPASAPAPKSMTNLAPAAEPAEGAGDAPADAPADAKPWDGPDWIAEKYRSAENPLEAQAQAYSEAVKKLGTKTEDLRKEIETEAREKLEAEIRENIDKERGAPEDPSGYEYPEGWEPPAAEGLDDAFRGWAKKHGLSQDAFNEAVELYGQTQVNLEAEMGKLGDNAQTRIATMNAWGSRNIPQELHSAAMKVMQTAEGFELMEHMMNRGRDAGYSPGSGGEPPRPLTREAIRERMNDPRYADPTKRDPAFVASIQKDWERFAAQKK